MAVMFDKNMEEIHIGDYIRIGGKCYVQVVELPSVGVGIDISKISPTNDSCFGIEYLKKSYRQIGNTMGLLPFAFLDTDSIEVLKADKYLELYL